MKRGVAVVGLVGVLLSAATAAAAQNPTVELTDVRVDASLRSLQVRVVSHELPPGLGLDPHAVNVSIDGRTLPTTAVVDEQVRATTVPRVLLVVDNSGSMLGQPMSEAQQAIVTFAAQAPPETEIGLLTFATSAKVVVPPTTDRSRLLGAVTAMRAQGETALHDAVIAAVGALAGSGDRRVVLLSDGGDTQSRGTLEQAIAATATSGVTVDAIGFRTNEAVEAALQQISTSGHGRVHTAQSSSELSAALATTSQPHALALDLAVLVPADVRGERRLDVRVGSAVGDLAASTVVPLGADTAGAPTARGWWGTRDALLVGLAGIAGSLLLGGLVLAGGGREQRRVHALLERYTTSPAPQKEGLRTASPVTRTALDIADRVVTSRDLQNKLAARLERAAVSLTPAEWLLLQAGAGAMTALFLAVLGWHVLLAVLFGGWLGWFAPRTYLNVRGARRQKAFEERLPDALQMVAGSLGAGYSLAQALDGVVREGTEPLAAEFGRALAESRLGVPVETTLQTVADRMGSRDFGWVVMAITVQREVGGNLAGILTTVAATMRERAMLRRHVRGLSAEGRLSAYILLGLPVALALYMLVARPQYIQPLYTTPIGLGMVAGAAILMTIGTLVMKAMVKVEI